MRTLLLLLLSLLASWSGFYWWRTERARGAAGDPLHRRPQTREYGIGFVTNFFDTLGIGSFAPTTAIFKIWRLVPDDRIPGTLNIGHAPPTILAAFIFISAVVIDPVLLVSGIAAATAGAWLGARLVVRLPLRTLRIVLGTILLIAAITFSLSNLELLPGGGSSTGLQGWRFAVAILALGVFGALMTAGFGLYAPCMVTLALLGMHPLTAFPMMMGACAFVQTTASLRFIDARSYALGPALGLIGGGIVGVLVAAFLVRSMPLYILRWIVVAAVLYAALAMLRSAGVLRALSRKRGESAAPGGPV